MFVLSRSIYSNLRQVDLLLARDEIWFSRHLDESSRAQDRQISGIGRRVSGVCVYWMRLSESARL
jgi:hypothetical protein